jgi:hypothetical protein
MSTQESSKEKKSQYGFKVNRSTGLPYVDIDDVVASEIEKLKKKREQSSNGSNNPKSLTEEVVNRKQ